MSRFYLIDTNVLLAACGLATQLRQEQVDIVTGWLTRFRDDEESFLLLDSDGAPLITKSRIIEEYQKKMLKAAFGWQIVRSKLEASKYLCYKVAFEGHPPNEYAALPPTLTRGWRDLSDRKFMAVALEHNRIYPRQRCKIVNATDSDWTQYASILRQHYIEVEQLLA